MALTRTLAALALSLAGTAGLASAQSPIVPGEPGVRFGARADCGPAGCTVDARADLSFGRNRHRARSRSHRGSIRPVRRSTCGPRRTHRVHTRRVWIPGHYRQVFHPAEYDYVTDPCGRTRRVLVQAAHYDDVWVPGHYETRRY